MRVAAVQMTSTRDVDANIATADRLVRAAAADGASLVVLPEKWPSLGEGSGVAAAAQSLHDGPAITWARALAAELDVDLVAGSMSERAPDGGKPFNASAHVGPDGGVRAVYRKLHLFDAEVAGRRYGESDDEAPGEDVVVSALADGTGIGMAVCYDLRFPELFRALALRGARILVLPSAFTPQTTLEHWEILLRARAIEEGCFVVAANQVGEHAPGLSSGGRSMVVGPTGVVLAQAAGGEGVVLCDLDLGAVEKARARIPSLANVRPGLVVG